MGRVPCKYIIKFLEDHFQHPEKAINQRIPSKTPRPIKPTLSSSSWGGAGGRQQGRRSQQGRERLGGWEMVGGEMPEEPEGKSLPIKAGQARQAGPCAQIPNTPWPAWRQAAWRQEKHADSVGSRPSSATWAPCDLRKAVSGPRFPRLLEAPASRVVVRT